MIICHWFVIEVRRHEAARGIPERMSSAHGGAGARADVNTTGGVTRRQWSGPSALGDGVDADHFHGDPAAFQGPRCVASVTWEKGNKVSGVSSSPSLSRIANTIFFGTKSRGTVRPFPRSSTSAAKRARSVDDHLVSRFTEEVCQRIATTLSYVAERSGEENVTCVRPRPALPEVDGDWRTAYAARLSSDRPSNQARRESTGAAHPVEDGLTFSSAEELGVYRALKRLQARFPRARHHRHRAAPRCSAALRQHMEPRCRGDWPGTCLDRGDRWPPPSWRSALCR
jgi:hypothetical protein